MTHPVSWFSIQGPNGHALQEFYKHVFGWQLHPMPGGDMLGVPSSKGGIPGGIGASPSHQASVAVYVTVGDIDAQFGKIQRAGGRMVMPKTELPGGMGTIAGFNDPAGNWIGLWQEGAKAAKASSAKKQSGAKKAGGAKKKTASASATTKKKASTGGAPKKKAAKRGR